MGHRGGVVVGVAVLGGTHRHVLERVPVRAVEAQARGVRGDVGVVRGIVDRDGDRARRQRVQLHLVGGGPALGHRHRGRVHRHPGDVVVGDGHRRLVGAALGHLRRQRAEAQLDGLAAVDGAVVGGGDLERHARIPAVECDVGGDAHVVAVGCAPLVGPRDRDHHRPLRVRTQRHRDRHRPALHHGVGRRPEAHLHRGLVVRNGHAHAVGRGHRPVPAHRVGHRGGVVVGVAVLGGTHRHVLDVSQFVLSKLRLGVSAVTSVLSAGSLIVTVTVPAGSVFSFTW